MLLPSEYEEHLATQPDEVRAMLQSHIRGDPEGRCAERIMQNPERRNRINYF